MSYLPERSSISAKSNIYYNASGAASVGSYVSWASQGVTGHDFTLTQSGTTFTIPDDGNTYILEAALAPAANETTQYGVSFQWERDAATLIGNAAVGLVMLNDAEVATGFWGDERARCYVRATGASVTCRVKITAVHGGAPSSLDGARYLWDAKARVVVWKI